MAAKRNTNASYVLHGDDVESLARGLVEIAMPETRRPVAMEIVREVVAANAAVDFYWYKPPKTEELSCYWDDAERNLLWITAGEVHVVADAGITRPSRPTNWSKSAGAYVGWLLPGADTGPGGAAPKPEIAWVVCPETGLRQPAGRICHDCEVVHDPPEDASR